jgi:hypothetical protein
MNNVVAFPCYIWQSATSDINLAELVDLLQTLTNGLHRDTVMLHKQLTNVCSLPDIMVPEKQTELVNHIDMLELKLELHKSICNAIQLACSLNTFLSAPSGEGATA